MRKLSGEESIPLTIGFPAKTTSEFWAMGAATERERNTEKSLKCVLKRMIGKTRKGWVYNTGSVEKVNQSLSTWNEGDSAHKIFEKMSWDVCLANVRGVILIMPSNLAP